MAVAAVCPDGSTPVHHTVVADVDEQDVTSLVADGTRELHRAVLVVRVAVEATVLHELHGIEPLARQESVVLVRRNGLQQLSSVRRSGRVGAVEVLHQVGLGDQTGGDELVRPRLVGVIGGTDVVDPDVVLGPARRGELLGQRGHGLLVSRPTRGLRDGAGRGGHLSHLGHLTRESLDVRGVLGDLLLHRDVVTVQATDHFLLRGARRADALAVAVPRRERRVGVVGLDLLEETCPEAHLVPVGRVQTDQRTHEECDGSHDGEQTHRVLIRVGEQGEDADQRQDEEPATRRERQVEEPHREAEAERGHTVHAGAGTHAQERECHETGEREPVDAQIGQCDVVEPPPEEVADGSDAERDQDGGEGALTGSNGTERGVQHRGREDEDEDGCHHLRSLPFGW